VGKPEGRRPLGRPRHRWLDNIRIDLVEVVRDGMDWIGVAQDRDSIFAFVTALRISVNFSRRDADGIVLLQHLRMPAFQLEGLTDRHEPECGFWRTRFSRKISLDTLATPQHRISHFSPCGSPPIDQKAT
jgi:hypothetical protein